MSETTSKPKNKKAAFSRLFDYLKPYKKWVAMGVLSNIALGILALLPPLYYGRITDQVIMNRAGSLASRYHILLISAILLFVIFVATSFFNWTRAFIMHVLGEKIILNLRKHIYSRLQMLSTSYFDDHQTGETMSRITNDTEAVEEFINHAADTLISDSLKIVAMVVVMFCISKTLAFVSLLPIPILFILAHQFSRRIRGVYRAVRVKLAEINSKVQENLSGIRVIKAFAREDYEYDSFCRNTEDYYIQRVDAIKKWTRFFPSVDLLVRMGCIAIWVVGALLVMRREATMGTLVVFISYLSILYEPIGNLARINDTILRSLAAAERIFEVIDEEPEIQDSESAIEMPQIRGFVQFDHVDFSYQDGEEVLKDICITAKPGQIVALVGKSGAGKTSIVSLIPRFYDTTHGKVLIDGVDVREIKQKSLRRQIAMVLQDTFLFNGTIKENIRYGRLDATDEEILEAAKAANCHEFIQEMPNEYNTEIGERGIKLSGGQKQRIAIARAILADPRILILDEATSSVDSESEYLIHKAMDRLISGRTTFVIAHRLSTIKNADQIITLEHGQVSEVGNHQSLMKRDGTYAQMVSMQFRLNEELN